MSTDLEKEYADEISEALDTMSSTRRDGMVDLVKVMLSVSSVALTVFASLLPAQGLHHYSQEPLLYAAIWLTVGSLLLCIGFGFYHLHYALVGLPSDMIEEIKLALRVNESVDQAALKLREAAVKHPCLYKYSIPIIYWSFYVSILSLCATALLKI